MTMNANGEIPHLHLLFYGEKLMKNYKKCGKHRKSQAQKSCAAFVRNMNVYIQS